MAEPLELICYKRHLAEYRYLYAVWDLACRTEAEQTLPYITSFNFILVYLIIYSTSVITQASLSSSSAGPLILLQYLEQRVITKQQHQTFDHDKSARMCQFQKDDEIFILKVLQRRTVITRMNFNNSGTHII